MKADHEYSFPEQSPWKPSPVPYLADHAKVQICGIECQCLGVFSNQCVVTIDLYCERSPKGFTVFHIDKSKINGAPCRVLSSLTYKPSRADFIHQDVLELCKQYEKRMEKGGWLQRILLFNPTCDPVMSLSLVFFWQQINHAIFSEFYLTEDGTIHTRDLGGVEGGY